MKNKKAETLEDAVSRISDGATLLVGGFGQPGVPEVLIDGVCDLQRRGLTIVTNNAGTGHSGIARLIEEGCVGKLICSFPWAKESSVFKEVSNTSESWLAGDEHRHGIRWVVCADIHLKC